MHDGIDSMWVCLDQGKATTSIHYFHILHYFPITKYENNAGQSWLCDGQKARTTVQYQIARVSIQLIFHPVSCFLSLSWPATHSGMTITCVCLLEIQLSATNYPCYFCILTQVRSTKCKMNKGTSSLCICNGNGTPFSAQSTCKSMSIKQRAEVGIFQTTCTYGNIKTT